MYETWWRRERKGRRVVTFEDRRACISCRNLRHTSILVMLSPRDQVETTAGLKLVVYKATLRGIQSTRVCRPMSARRAQLLFVPSFTISDQNGAGS